VCLSAGPSVRLSQVGVSLKRLNAGSRRHTIARRLWFSGAENFGKTQTGSPPTEAPNAGSNAGAVSANWRLSTRSVVNLAQSQVYHTERTCLQHVRRDAVRRSGLSPTADPPLQSCYCIKS